MGFFLPRGVLLNKKHACYCVFTHSNLAEEQGFEPWHRVTSLRAFQARPFSLLGIPPEPLN